MMTVLVAALVAAALDLAIELLRKRAAKTKTKLDDTAVEVLEEVGPKVIEGLTRKEKAPRPPVVDHRGR